MKKDNTIPSWQKYPWQDWFEQDKFVLAQGVDFTCDPYVMAQQVRNAANKYTVNGRKLYVSIYVDQSKVNVYTRT